MPIPITVLTVTINLKVLSELASSLRQSPSRLPGGIMILMSFVSMPSKLFGSMALQIAFITLGPMILFKEQV